MPTFANLVDETLGMFASFTGVVEQACELSADITDADVSAILADRGMVGRGLYEIDDELVYAAVGDAATGTLTFSSFGRAQQSSSAVAHTAGARVTRAPRVPRSRVKSMLNQAILSLYPDLFAVKVDQSQTVSVTQWGYSLPADVEEVLDVQYRTPPFGNWVGVRQWRIDQMADSTDFATGKSLAIGQELWSSAPLKITYKARPGPLVNNADEWATVTGLPVSASDLAVLWASERLVSADELLRTQTRSVEQSQRGLISPAGAAANASRLMHQQFAERLAVERRALLNRYNLPRTIRMWT